MEVKGFHIKTFKMMQTYWNKVEQFTIFLSKVGQDVFTLKIADPYKFEEKVRRSEAELGIREKVIPISYQREKWDRNIFVNDLLWWILCNIFCFNTKSVFVYLYIVSYTMKLLCKNKWPFLTMFKYFEMTLIFQNYWLEINVVAC